MGVHNGILKLRSGSRGNVVVLSTQTEAAPARGKRLTLPSSGRAPASRAPPLMSNVKQLVVRRQQRLMHCAALHVRAQCLHPEETLAAIEQRFGLAHCLGAIQQSPIERPVLAESGPMRAEDTILPKR